MASVVYKPNMGAGRELCSLPGVGAMTSKIAESIRSSATSMLDPDEGYANEDFEKVEIDMNGYVVRTKTDHARYSENRNKTLTKAFHSV